MAEQEEPRPVSAWRTLLELWPVAVILLGAVISFLWSAGLAVGAYEMLHLMLAD